MYFEANRPIVICTTDNDAERERERERERESICGASISHNVMFHALLCTCRDDLFLDLAVWPCVDDHFIEFVGRVLSHPVRESPATW